MGIDTALSVWRIECHVVMDRLSIDLMHLNECWSSAAVATGQEEVMDGSRLYQSRL